MIRICVKSITFSIVLDTCSPKILRISLLLSLATRFHGESVYASLICLLTVINILYTHCDTERRPQQNVQPYCESSSCNFDELSHMSICCTLETIRRSATAAASDQNDHGLHCHAKRTIPQARGVNHRTVRVPASSNCSDLRPARH